jgi:hypothetical protein
MSSETISGGVPMPANHAAAIIPPAIPDLFSVYLAVARDKAAALHGAYLYPLHVPNLH